MSGICDAIHLKQGYLPYLNLIINLWDEINKSGNVSKKDENKIYNEVNKIFKNENKTDEDLPFDLHSTQFSVKLLWADSQPETYRPFAAVRWAYQNYTTQHEFIEITGKNGCIYTIGLYVDMDNGKPEIRINDHAFTRCTQKNKACANSILEKGVYEKIDTKTKKIIYQIKDKQHCNILCKNMVNMRDDDRNKYTPISHTRQKHLGSYMEGVLNIDHLKLLQYIIYNSITFLQLRLTGFESDHTSEEVKAEIIEKYGLKPILWYDVLGAPSGETILIFKTIEDIEYAHNLNTLTVPVLSAKKLNAELYDIPYLKTPLDQASYSGFASMKFKREGITKALSWMGLGKVCSKATEFNCRTFAEDFYTDSTKMLSTMKSILPEPVMEPKILEYVDVILPFSKTPARESVSLSPNPKSKSLTPKASQKRKSKSLTPKASQKRKSKSLTPKASQKTFKRKSKSLSPKASQKTFKRKSKSLSAKRSKSVNRM